MLNLIKNFTSKVDPIVYNRDLQTVFDAFNGIESQRFSLGGLTITPGVDSTSVFQVTDASGSVLLSVDSVNKTVNVIGSTTSVFTSDVEVTNSSKGLILKSPNNTRYRIQANDDGSLNVSTV